jgi:hypothetical protein
MSTPDISRWDDLERTPKSKNNVFNFMYVIGDRFDTARAQRQAEARARTSKAVEKMRAEGIEPAKLTISKKQAARDAADVRKMNWKLR